MRGRKEIELEPILEQENQFGATIRAWRRYRGLSVTDLAMAAGFGKNGRGYISKIERNQIKHLGEEQLNRIAKALNVTSATLTLYHVPDEKDKHAAKIISKVLLDEAIKGCIAWLDLYSQEEKPLDWARTHFELAKLYRGCANLSENAEEREQFLNEALRNIDLAINDFEKYNAPGSKEDAIIVREELQGTLQSAKRAKILDEAIKGTRSLLEIHNQEERSLDQARNIARLYLRLAELHQDRAQLLENMEEKQKLLNDAIKYVDLAINDFEKNDVPGSLKDAQVIRSKLETVVHLKI